MAIGKKVLVFYPHNPFELNAGTHRRVYELLNYFRSRGFSTDLLSLNGFSNEWRAQDIARKDLVDSINICRWKPVLKNRVYREITRRAGILNDLTILPLTRMFKKMINSGGYGFVLISYVYWAALADLVGKNIVKIVDLHDFATLSGYLHSGKKDFRLGRMFEGEIRAISKFNYAFSISEEERLSLSPFCAETRFVNVPMSYQARFSDKASEEYDYDLFFVGSDNEFNREGMDWFMKSVYPLLPSNIRIAIVGKLSKFVEKKQNIALIPYQEDLDRLYSRAKVSFCPLKRGTGLKIKVIEALSHAKPVVTTSWGLSGMLQKENNGCLVGDTAEEFAKAIILLVENENECLRQRKTAEEFFMKHYSTEIVYKNLDEVFLKTHQMKTI